MIEPNQSSFIFGKIMIKMSRTQISVLVISLILIADQVMKLWIKTTMMLGQEIKVLGNWFILHFTENNGMAFGFEFGGEWGKIILSIFRIAAIIAIIFYIKHLIKIKSPLGVMISFSLILAGAIGNIIDSAFYGLIFSDSYSQVATFLPEEGGYAPFLYGRVVDMLYFPIIEGHYPDWFPWVGSNQFIFFRPVFNLADSAITVGVFILLFFHRSFFKSN